MSKTNKIKRKNYQKEINDVLNEYLEVNLYLGKIYPKDIIGDMYKIEDKKEYK